MVRVVKIEELNRYKSIKLRLITRVYLQIVMLKRTPADLFSFLANYIHHTPYQSKKTMKKKY